MRQPSTSLGNHRPLESPNAGTGMVQCVGDQVAHAGPDTPPPPPSNKSGSTGCDNYDRNSCKRLHCQIATPVARAIGANVLSACLVAPKLFLQRAHNKCAILCYKAEAKALCGQGVLLLLRVSAHRVACSASVATHQGAYLRDDSIPVYQFAEMPARLISTTWVGVLRVVSQEALTSSAHAYVNRRKLWGLYTSLSLGQSVSPFCPPAMVCHTPEAIAVL